MVYYLIMCRSLTYAQRINSALERSGIEATVIRSPASISPAGCGYSVQVGERRLSQALSVLNREGLVHQGVFVGTPEQGYREVDF